MARKEPAAKVISSLEEKIAEDWGSRGIEGLRLTGELEIAARSLRTAQAVAILTGFCIPPTETDGPVGALVLARALRASGCQRVCIVTDSVNQEVLDPPVPLVTFPSPCDFDEVEGGTSYEKTTLSLVQELLQGDHTSSTPLDHVVAIERVGQAADGKFYTMRARDISASCAPLDEIVREFSRLRQGMVVGIGDGGNEIGMGKVLDRVHECIPQGRIIGCITSCDALITAGVSNWGASALGASLFLLSDDPHKELSQFFSVEFEETVLKVCVDAGATDGPTGQAGMMVDGFDFSRHRDEMLRVLQELVQ